MALMGDRKHFNKELWYNKAQWRWCPDTVQLAPHHPSAVQENCIVSCILYRITGIKNSLY